MPASKNTSKLRDGVMKRGSTWSYVIRVKDPETGISKPRWVGGFATEEDAKAARDEARVKARHGEYIDRNRITVAAYLDDWIDAHAMEIKPRTLADYRACIRLYAVPRIGHLPIQAVRPSTITKLYRDLLTSGGRDGQPLAVATVTHLHAVLRKAFRDAVIVDELIGSNPVERAKRPRGQAQEPGTVWTIAQLRAFLATAQQHRLFAFFHVAAYTGARRGELLNLRWKDIDLDGKKITITGSTAVIGRRAGQRDDQERPDAGRLHRRRDRGRPAPAEGRPGCRATEGGRLLARNQGRVRVHDRMGRADLPRYRHVADDQAHPRQQATTARAAPRPAAPARHHVAALRRPGPRRRGPPGPRRSGHHPPRLRPCDPLRRSRRRGHFRRGGPGHLLANPLARKPLPRSEEASELRAAYRNRTDDLRITSASL